MDSEYKDRNDVSRPGPGPRPRASSETSARSDVFSMVPKSGQPSVTALEFVPGSGSNVSSYKSTLTGSRHEQQQEQQQQTPSYGRESQESQQAQSRAYGQPPHQQQHAPVYPTDYLGSSHYQQQYSQEQQPYRRQQQQQQQQPYNQGHSYRGASGNNQRSNSGNRGYSGNIRDKPAGPRSDPSRFNNSHHSGVSHTGSSQSSIPSHHGHGASNDVFANPRLREESRRVSAFNVEALPSQSSQLATGKKPGEQVASVGMPTGAMPFNPTAAPLGASLTLGMSPSAMHSAFFVNHYHSIACLESNSAATLLNRKAINYKAVSATDGELYLFRRIVGPLTSRSDTIIHAAEVWKRVNHPGVVHLHEIFTTRKLSMDGKTNEVIFVYQFFPKADSMMSVFFNEHQHRAGPVHAIPEATIWTIAVQLISAVQAIHSANLACRDSMSLSTLVMTGRNRVRIGRIGMADALSVVDPQSSTDTLSSSALTVASNASAGHGRSDPSVQQISGTLRGAVQQYQREDLVNLGIVLLCLCVKSLKDIIRGGVLVIPPMQVLELLRNTSQYSMELLQLVTVLLSNMSEDLIQLGSRGSTIEDIILMVSSRFSTEYATVWQHSDAVETQLRREFDASRFLRLETLLSFAIDRCDPVLDPLWAETGYAYILKLFRDYVFHQSDDQGRPLLNYGHVLECLNRLDVGSEERILLSSRDNTSLIIASFAEIKRMLIAITDELRMNSAMSQMYM